MKNVPVLAAAAALALSAAACASTPPRAPAAVRVPDTPGERHLTNVRQLTFGGDNAEAYWSWKGDKLIFQMSDPRVTRRARATDPAPAPGTPVTRECDQIYVMDADGNDEHLVSTGKGRTTCPYFLPGDKEIVYASTHHVSDDCPRPPVAVPGGYTWPLFDYDVYKADADGSNVVRLFGSPGYDAEPTAAKDGRIVFTSDRGGDLDIYTMNPDGSDVQQLTNTLGYDGGPFFSPDGTKIVYRTYHPTDPAEVENYKRLLAARWVQPSKMSIWVMDRDGSNQHQVTDVGGSSFAPFFTPDGQRILFASNFEDDRGWKFDLYLINLDGTGLEKVTTAPEFDSFPMFSPDGKQLVWESNRFNDEAHARDTNIFIADWVE